MAVESDDAYRAIGARASLRTGGTYSRGRLLIATAVAVWFVAVAFAALGIAAASTQLLVSDIAAPLLGLLGGVAVLRAVRRVEVPRARFAWTVVGVAILVYAVGDGLWSIFDLIGGEVDSPSLADVAYVAYYPLIVAALLSFPSVHSGRSDGVRLAIDSSIVFIGGGIVVLHTLFAPALASTYPDPLSAGLALGYPIGDLVLLFGVAATALRRPTGVDARALSALLLSLLLMFLGDVGIWAAFGQRVGRGPALA